MCQIVHAQRGFAVGNTLHGVRLAQGTLLDDMLQHVQQL